MQSMGRRPRVGHGAVRHLPWYLWLGLAAAPLAAADLTDMSLAELGRIPVTSVSREAEPLSDAPAAIFVITHEAIQRSGATTLPEALRLAPNLLVTQLSSSNFVVAARGFGGNPDDQNFSNKLLLLIDGRSVYTPLFSGIYLDTQDLPLEDVDRIEVISGPGATLWGANAVNGVINVITRAAYLTQGTTVTAAAGDQERLLTAQHGGDFGIDGSYRVYVKGMQHDAMGLAAGGSAQDDWRRGQAGFRMDLVGSQDTRTLQGDVYTGDNGEPGPGSESVSGANLLGRWERQGEHSSLRLQGYFDHVQRAAPQDGAALVLNTLDLELQHNLQWGARQQLVWGAGARVYRYRIDNSATLLFLPAHRTLQIWNLYGQDTLALAPRLKLTAGIKLEHNSFSGWEPQPDLRLTWQPADSMMLWAAASRAVRAPTPFDTDVLERLGSLDYLVGKPDFKSEKVMAYESGFRGTISPRFALSMSAFYNRYDDLRTVELAAPPTYLPLHWDNLMAGHTYGLTAWATWQVADWWRLEPGATLLRKRLHQKAGASAILGVAQAGNDPQVHALLTSSFDLGERATLDLSLRRVGALPDPALPAYTELTARLAWHLSDAWELSVRGDNLLDHHHQEYPAPGGELISRSVLAEVRWSP